MALSRSASIVIPILLLAMIAITAFTLLSNEPDSGFDPDDTSPPGVTGPTPSEPTGPKATGPTGPTGGTGATNGGTNEPPKNGIDEPLIPPPPIRKKLTVGIDWSPPAVDAPGGADFPRIGGSPIARLPRDKVVERTIFVDTDPGVPPPVRMRVVSGSPWGEALFAPEPDGKTFVLRDHYGADGPRVLRFELNHEGTQWVERFLPARSGDATFRIGRPSVLRVKVSTPGNRTAVCAVEIDMHSQSGSGELALPNVHAGNVVVKVGAKGFGWLRRVLRCPGGPYELMLEDAAELNLRIVRSGDGGDKRPFWSCAAPSQGGQGSGNYAAERSYHREQNPENGLIEFLNLPQGWSGTVIVWHPLYATQALAVAHFRDTEQVVRPAPRPIVDVSILDAKTNQKIESALVLTSADANTVYDKIVAQERVLPPRGDWHQPAPYMGFSIVGRTENPPSGHTMRLHVDTLIEKMDVLAVAPGYAPALQRDVQIEGVREIAFRLAPLTPENAGTIVLELPEHVAPADVTVPKLYHPFVSGQDDAKTLTLRTLVPGRYRLQFPGANPALEPLQIDVGPGETKRVPLR